MDTTVVDNGTDIESDKHSRLTKVDIEVDGGSPMPVSTRANASASTDLAWIFAHYGIRPASNSACLIDGWKEIKPVAPRLVGTFEDDFGEPCERLGCRRDCFTSRKARSGSPGDFF